MDFTQFERISFTDDEYQAGLHYMGNFMGFNDCVDIPKEKQQEYSFRGFFAEALIRRELGLIDELEYEIGINRSNIDITIGGVLYDIKCRTNTSTASTVLYERDLKNSKCDRFLFCNIDMKMHTLTILGDIANDNKLRQMPMYESKHKGMNHIQILACELENSGILLTLLRNKVMAEKEVKNMVLAGLNQGDVLMPENHRCIWKEKIEWFKAGKKGNPPSVTNMKDIIKQQLLERYDAKGLKYLIDDLAQMILDKKFSVEQAGLIYMLDKITDKNM